MAKRYGKPRHSRHSRPVESKRSRVLERIRIYLRARLSEVYLADSDPDRDQHGRDEFGCNDALGAASDAEARAYCGYIVRRDAADDPELYCLSPVTDDEGTEF